MAQKRLLAFLEKLDDELKTTSPEYRKGTGQFLTHDFVIYPQAMKDEMRKTIFRAVNIPSKQKGTMYKENKQAISNEIDKFFTRAKQSVIDKKNNNKQWKEAITIKINNSKIFRAIITQPEGKRQNIYAMLFNLYRDHLEEMYQNILKGLKLESLNRNSTTPGSKKVREMKTGADVFEFGHLGESANARQQINNAVFDAVQNQSANPTEMGQQLSKLPGIERNFLIFKDSRSGVATVTIQSRYDNQAAQKQERSWARQVRKDLDKSLKILKTEIATLSGSDSLLEGYRKNAGTKIIGTFKSKKSLKVKSEDFRHKKPQTSATLDISPAYKRAKTKTEKGTSIRRKRVAGSRKVSKGVSSNPLQLIGLINQKLPETVRKNMGEPGLVNQTGRFANSVRLTDVVKTPQGFPSFGYTYQKEPYQVFEVGAGAPPWASGERDPRTLIDRSIREIAAQFAIGRFYTRRE